MGWVKDPKMLGTKQGWDIKQPKLNNDMKVTLANNIILTKKYSQQVVATLPKANQRILKQPGLSRLQKVPVRVHLSFPSNGHTLKVDISTPVMFASLNHISLNYRAASSSPLTCFAKWNLNKLRAWPMRVFNLSFLVITTIHLLDEEKLFTVPDQK